MKIYYSFYKCSDNINNNHSKFSKFYYLFSDNNSLKIVNKNFNYFNPMNGLNLFFSKGKKLSLYLLFNIYFKDFYYSIYRKNDQSNFFFYNEIKSSIKDNTFLNNPVNMFKWYLNYFSFMFNFKNTIKKKIKTTKFENKSKNFKIVFIPEKKRNMIFFRWLKRLFVLNYTNNLFLTIKFLLNDIFFNFKNSILYKYKINFYKNLLNN